MKGKIVSLRVPILKNFVGAIGVCVHDEQDNCIFLFENGNFATFSAKQQNHLLNDQEQQASSALTYNYVSAIQLTKDFNNGRFNEVFS